MSRKKKIILCIAILAMVIVSFFGGQTYSKYVTELKGNGMAEVATWSFKVNGEKDQVQTINLGSTCNNKTLVDNKIAPGTEGSFNIVLDASGSDVGIDYKIKFSDESKKPNNLKFIYNNIEYNSILELEDSLSGTIDADANDKLKTLTINWQWKYQTGSTPEEIAKNDIIDTQNAQEISNYTFNVNVSGTQVAPQT